MSILEIVFMIFMIVFLVSLSALIEYRRVMSLNEFMRNRAERDDK